MLLLQDVLRPSYHQAAEAKRSRDACESSELCVSQVLQTSFSLKSLNILQFPGSGQISQIKYRSNDLHFLLKQWIIPAGHAETQWRLCQALCCVLPRTHMAALMLLLWPYRPCDQYVSRILFPVCVSSNINLITSVVLFAGGQLSLSKQVQSQNSTRGKWRGGTVTGREELASGVY